MDLTLPGKKVELVFSICQIRHFATTTDCLTTEIIVFVNKIVKVIHLCTQQWEGMPSKNYGEKYMLVWKLPEFKDAIDGNGSEIFFLDPETIEMQKVIEAESSIASPKGASKDKGKIPPANAENLDDSIKHNSERTSLLGDKDRKKSNETPNTEDEKEDAASSERGSLTKI